MANECAKRYYTDQVHFLRRDLTQADRGVARVVGVIPAGSVILKPCSGVNVSTLFNDSGTDLLDIGSSATGDLWATDLVISAVGFLALDEAVSSYVAVDTTITATYAGQNSDGTTGAAQVVIAFIPPNLS
jgi:hypothetical protein